MGIFNKRKVINKHSLACARINTRARTYMYKGARTDSRTQTCVYLAHNKKTYIIHKHFQRERYENVFQNKWNEVIIKKMSLQSAKNTSCLLIIFSFYRTIFFLDQISPMGFRKTFWIFHLFSLTKTHTHTCTQKLTHTHAQTSSCWKVIWPTVHSNKSMNLFQTEQVRIGWIDNISAHFICMKHTLIILSAWDRLRFCKVIFKIIRAFS